MPPDPTAPPGSLDATSKTLYRKVRGFLREQETWQDTDREFLAHYVRCLEIARAAVDQLKPNELTVMGAKGPVVNPLVTIYRNAMRDARDVAGDLLIPPRARKQFELEVRERAGSKFGL